MKHGVRGDGDCQLLSNLLNSQRKMARGLTPGHFVLMRLQGGECSCKMRPSREDGSC
jgi:hypothetical protein